MAKKTKATKTSKKKKRVRIPTDYEKIDRIWAEHGVVRVLLKDGQQRSMTVLDAAIRARQLNAMNVTPWHKAGHLKLVSKIIDVCKEAAYQVERGDKKAGQLNNMYLGKGPNGQPVEELVSEERVLQSYQLQYHTLKEDEIRAVIRDDRFKSNEQRKVIMQHTHAMRLADESQEEKLIVGPDGRPIPTA